MSELQTDGLRAYRALVSTTTREAVLRAIDDAIDRPDLPTVAAIARAAGVSRGYIHKHPDLWEKIRRLGLQHAEAQRRLEDEHADLRAGRAADRTTLTGQVLRQRRRIDELNARVAELEAARARHLGEQLLLLDESPPISAMESLVASEHLAAENERLQRELDEALSLVGRLRSELGGARQALAEALEDSRADAGHARPVPQLRRGPAVDHYGKGDGRQ